jgi:multiple antibiotic resistance protein
MFILLCVFFLSGALIMKFFGITLPGIRIAGGLVVAKIGFALLASNDDSTHTEEEHAEGRKKTDIAFSPLAMPLLSGPGAIAAIMGLAGNLETHDVAHYSVAIAAILVVCAICWIVLRSSDKLLKFLGVNGAHALTKIMGFLLLCMGVQLVINGITALNWG